MDAIILKAGNEYLVDPTEVGSNDHFRYYRATSKDVAGLELMLKITTDVKYNGLIEREAYILSELKDRAEQIEAEHSHVRPGDPPINYSIVFPTVVENFVAKEQGARAVLVLRFDSSDNLSDLAPLSLIRQRDKVRVDPKTGAWIMGKLLKTLVFAHSQNIKVGNLGEDNVLIVRKRHYVTVLDWSSAFLFASGVPPQDTCEDIVAATTSVFRLLGGDPTTGTLPDDEQLVGNTYADFFAGLMRGAWCDARVAHSAFYQMVEANWGRKFHPYTTVPL